MVEVAYVHNMHTCLSVCAMAPACHQAAVTARRRFHSTPPPCARAAGDVPVVLSASNSYSCDRTTSTLHTYFDMMSEHSQTCSTIKATAAAAVASTTTLDAASMPAAFGGGGGGGANAVPAACGNSTLSFYLFGENFSRPWQELQAQYALPSTFSAADVALSFGIGGYGSGVAFHLHGPGFSEVRLVAAPCITLLLFEAAVMAAARLSQQGTIGMLKTCSCCALVAHTMMLNGIER
jgi:hypothetical protein